MTLNEKLGGGEGGIRTHGTVSRTLVFKTSALNHSATSPKCRPDNGHGLDVHLNAEALLRFS